MNARTLKGRPLVKTCEVCGRMYNPPAKNAAKSKTCSRPCAYELRARAARRPRRSRSRDLAFQAWVLTLAALHPDDDLDLFVDDLNGYAVKARERYQIRTDVCPTCRTRHRPPRCCPVCHNRHDRHPEPCNRGRRWPLPPLLEHVPGGSHHGLTRRLPLSGGTVADAARHGLTDEQADQWAVGLGVHPALVWPGWFDAALTVLDDVFVNGGGWRPAWLAEQPASTDRSVAA